VFREHLDGRSGGYVADLGAAIFGLKIHTLLGKQFRGGSLGKSANSYHN
jgi:hypothetical protein